jgi:hypothetical protein
MAEGERTRRVDTVMKARRLIVDIQNPGNVTVALLNTDDDAMGDYWVAYETDPDTAQRIGEGLIAKAAEARAGRRPVR